MMMETVKTQQHQKQRIWNLNVSLQEMMLQLKKIQHQLDNYTEMYTTSYPIYKIEKSKHN